MNESCRCALILDLSNPEKEHSVAMEAEDRAALTDVLRGTFQGTHAQRRAQMFAEEKIEPVVNHFKAALVEQGKPSLALLVLLADALRDEWGYRLQRRSAAEERYVLNLLKAVGENVGRWRNMGADGYRKAATEGGYAHMHLV